MLRGKPLGIVLAGLAAYAWYKYSKMSPDEKRDLTNNLKEKGKKIFGSLMPESQTSNGTSGSSFAGGSQYAG